MIPFNLHRRIPLLRRPFYQRDKAIAELSTSHKEYWAAWVMHRSPKRLSGESAVSEPESLDDRALVARVVESYLAANNTPLGKADSFWLSSYADEKMQVHEAFANGDMEVAAQALRNPVANMLLYGFDSINKKELGPAVAWWRESHRQMAADNLLRLAEAVGVRRLENPEANAPGESACPEEVLAKLDEAFRFTIRFPNPFPAEIGLATSRGVASNRAIQALYQAWRIVELLGRQMDARVVEIGAGLGRTAYYAQQFGLTDYTIIDLPMTNVAQGYFLGRVLGDSSVCLYRETGSGIRILPPCGFFDADDRYDLVLNVDSLTEMAPTTARAYAAAFKARAGTFWSVNHECNALTVRGIFGEIGERAVARMPYWLRRGYVDEVFLFGAQQMPRC